MYCWACGQVVPDQHHVCANCLASVYEPSSQSSTVGTSAAIKKWPNNPQVSGTIIVVNRSISDLVSSYSASLEQIRLLEETGVDKSSLSLLKKNVQVMKAEADRQRQQLTSSIKAERWARLETEAKKFEETRERQMQASRIVQEMESSNLLSESVLSTKFFNPGPGIVDAMHTPCATQDNFEMKIGALANLFDIELEPLRSKVRDAKDEWKSIKLLEEWAKQNSLAYDAKMFEVWRAIVDLRNASYPFHKADTRVVRLVEFFGQDFPPDYSKLWKAILQHFLLSIDAFMDLLSRARALVR